MRTIKNTLLIVAFFCFVGHMNAQQCDHSSSNAGLELNNFTYWEGKRGDVKCSFGRKIKNITSGISSQVHNIVSNGQDCDVPQIEMVYKGSYALMLGNKSKYDRKKASFAYYTFEVTNENKDFYFYYSLILQNPDHSNCKKPYFKYTITSSSDEIKEFEIIADSSNPFFNSAFGECDKDNLVFSNWTCERTDLSAYLGQCVTIEFLVTDCTEGGHWGIAYIDGLGESPNSDLVSAFALNKSDIGYCFGESIIMDGSASQNEASHFISIEESDANMGRPNPDSELSKWFVGEQAGQKNITHLFSELGGRWECNKYYRIKLAVAASCGGWVENTKLVKISCPEVDAGSDVCCLDKPTIGEVNPISNYSYSWSPKAGLADPLNAVTEVDCSNLLSVQGDDLHAYPTLIGDFDNNNIADIAFVGQNWSQSASGLHVGTGFSNGNGNYSFEQFKSGDGGGIHTYPALTGDFNGDGKTDIVFVGQNWSGSGTGLHIRTKFSNGDGTYSGVQFKSGDGSGVHTYPALTGDFNGDGKTDLVFIGQDWSGSGIGLHIRTKFSNGDGTYSGVQFKSGDGGGVHTYPALTGDFNGDGKTDLVFVGQDWSGSGTGLHIRTKFSNGDGTYSGVQFKSGDGSGVHTYPALSGDFNGDGKTDLVFVGQDWSGSGTGLHIRTKFSNGDGTYSSVQFKSGDGAGVHTYPALTGDCNGDGKTDIVFVGQNWSGSGTGLHIRTKFSNGDGTYSGVQFKSGDGSGVHTYPALTGDFNGDGKTDLVFVGQNWSGAGTGLHVRTKFAKGDGTYSHKQMATGGENLIFTLTATDEYGCRVSDDVRVYQDKPKVQLTLKKEGCCTHKIMMESTNTTSFTWSTGESNTNSIEISQSGTYSVTATNPCGTTVESINVDMLQLNEFRDNFPKIIHPTTFTPNGDGVNDVFKLIHYATDAPLEGSGPAYNATEYSFYVFDRWGHILYEKHGETCTGFINGEIGWDGTNNAGVLQPGGVYNWKLELLNCRITQPKNLTFVTSQVSYKCVDCRFGLNSTCGFFKDCYKYEVDQVIETENVGQFGSVTLL